MTTEVDPINTQNCEKKQEKCHSVRLTIKQNVVFGQSHQCEPIADGHLNLYCTIIPRVNERSWYEDKVLLSHNTHTVDARNPQQGSQSWHFTRSPHTWEFDFRVAKTIILCSSPNYKKNSLNSGI